MAVGVVSLLIFAAGYFGAKLPALEGIAVVQLAALLLFTVDNTAPTYEGLKYLGWALGATTIFRKQYFYEDTQLPYTVRSQFDANDSISTFNIFLSAILIPPLVAVVLKILSVTAFKSSLLMQRVWLNCLTTFTFYGLLFLSYGELCSTILNVKYLKTEMSGFVGLAIGSVILLLLIVYQICLCRFPQWFGSFKKRFVKYSISSHFYLFSSV